MQVEGLIGVRRGADAARHAFLTGLGAPRRGRLAGEHDLDLVRLRLGLVGHGRDEPRA